MLAGLLAFITFAVLANVAYIVWVDVREARAEREQAVDPIFRSVGPIEGGAVRYEQWGGVDVDRTKRILGEFPYD